MAARRMLETLPTELKSVIINQTPDVSTLSTLIHASPDFHAIYLSDREAILHNATIRGLQRVKLVRTKIARNFGIDLLGVDFPVSTSNRNKRLSTRPILESTIVGLQAQYQACGREGVRLSWEGGSALRTLIDCYIWSREVGGVEWHEVTGRSWKRFEDWEHVPPCRHRSLIQACLFVFGEGSPLRS